MTELRQNEGSRPTLYFLVGPTAVGKTQLSLDCARALGAEILSCDSLCVYRGMDIGTAKPSPAERAAVPHHGIDLVAPARQYSVEEYTHEARRVVADCFARGRQVLVVGGSGFYLKSFFEPVTDGIEVSAETTRRVEELYQSGGLPALLGALAPYDPNSKARLDRRNPRRVFKALERCMATGQPLVELQAAFAALPEPYAGVDKRVCLLERDERGLKQRVRLRIANMFREGLADEVRGLIAEGVEANPSAAGAIGYRETLAWVREGADEARIPELKESIAVHTDQLIRKQRIWFRRQIPVHSKVPAESATVAEAFPGKFA